MEKSEESRVKNFFLKVYVGEETPIVPNYEFLCQNMSFCAKM